MNLDQLVTQNLGKPVEREDPTNVDQCFDWAFAYIDALSIPRTTIRHLRAYEIWTLATDETRRYFDLIPNTPTAVPQKGDIVIFDTTVGVSGHVCIASGNNDGTKTFQSTDQNWNGHLFIEYIWHNYTGVLGWLRPKKTTVMAIISQDELDKIRLDRDTNYNLLQIEKSKVEELIKQIGDPRFKQTLIDFKETLNKLPLS